MLIRAAPGLTHNGIVVVSDVCWVRDMGGATDNLEQALRWADRTRHMLLATVDETGTPRLTPVEECRPAGEDRVAVRAWIDVAALQSLGAGSRLTLLLWEEQGHGYQLTGQLVRSQEAAVLDGLTEIEQQVHFPQVERYLLVQVDSVEEFRLAVPAHAPLPR